MLVLVTGHLGYIGSVLTPALITRGHTVVGMDTDLYRGCDLGPVPQIQGLRVDIRDVEPDDLAGYDAVVHLAGICNDPLGDLDASLTMDVNWGATVRLARAARRAGVGRFVFSSTCSVYGWADPSTPVTEESTCRPLTAYAKSKLNAEREVLDMASPDFSPIILRSGSLYGPSPRFRSDLVVNGLSASAFTSRRLEMETDGSPWRPLVRINDVAATMAVMLEAPRDAVHAQTYNVGTDALNLQVRDIAALVAEENPPTSVSMAATAGPDERSYRASFGRLARAFPQLLFETDLRAGIRSLVNAFNADGLENEALLEGRYARLAVIKRRIAAGELDAALRATTAAHSVLPAASHVSSSRVQ
jgi:nucleoside-diphosphate-sugar epimerase